jgi:hypothetical protein
MFSEYVQPCKRSNPTNSDFSFVLFILQSSNGLKFCNLYKHWIVLKLMT